MTPASYGYILLGVSAGIAIASFFLAQKSNICQYTETKRMKTLSDLNMMCIGITLGVIGMYKKYWKVEEWHPIFILLISGGVYFAAYTYVKGKALLFPKFKPGALKIT